MRGETHCPPSQSRRLPPRSADGTSPPRTISTGAYALQPAHEPKTASISHRSLPAAAAAARGSVSGPDESRTLLLLRLLLVNQSQKAPLSMVGASHSAALSKTAGLRASRLNAPQPDLEKPTREMLPPRWKPAERAPPPMSHGTITSRM